MNVDKMKAKLEKLEIEIRQKFGEDEAARILAEIESEAQSTEFGWFIEQLELTDAQGRVLLWGDHVTSIYNQFESGEILGVVDYRDGHGIEFVVRTKDGLRNVGPMALQFISRTRIKE